MSGYDVELLARLQREEMAREVARIGRAAAAQGGRDRAVWRRRLAAVLVALAARIAPMIQPAVEAETRVGTVRP